MTTLTPERRELVHDDERWSRSERGNADQVEQDPGADLCRQLGVRCRVQAEQHRLACTKRILQREAWAQIWCRNSFENQTEPRAEAGETLALDLPELLDVANESLRCGRVGNIAQQIDERQWIEVLEQPLGRAFHMSQLECLEDPQRVSLCRCAIHVGVLRIPLALHQAISDARWVAPQRIPSQVTADRPDRRIWEAANMIPQTRRGLAVDHDDRELLGERIQQELKRAGLSGAGRSTHECVMTQLSQLNRSWTDWIGEADGPFAPAVPDATSSAPSGEPARPTTFLRLLGFRARSGRARAWLARSNHAEHAKRENDWDNNDPGAKLKRQLHGVHCPF